MIDVSTLGNHQRASISIRWSLTFSGAWPSSRNAQRAPAVSTVGLLQQFEVIPQQWLLIIKDMNNFGTGGTGTRLFAHHFLSTRIWRHVLFNFYQMGFTKAITVSRNLLHFNDYNFCCTKKSNVIKFPFHNYLQLVDTQSCSKNAGPTFFNKCSHM